MWLNAININAIPNQGFCLHFMSDYRGTTGKAFADQFAGRNGQILVEKMQSADAAQYCGNWCILGSSLEPNRPLRVSDVWANVACDLQCMVTAAACCANSSLVIAFDIRSLLDMQVDASADITGCIVKQQQSLESTGGLLLLGFLAGA